MTTARKPAVTVESDNLMIIIGQLLEATKAASEGLKSVGAEVHSNAKAIIAAVKTLEQMEEKLASLECVIQDNSNAGNLVNVTRGHTEQIANIRSGIEELRSLGKELRQAITTLNSQVGTLDRSQAYMKSTKNVIWDIAKMFGWVITTAVAFYAAMSGK